MTVSRARLANARPLRRLVRARCKSRVAHSYKRHAHTRANGGLSHRCTSSSQRRCRLRMFMQPPHQSLDALRITGR